MAELIREEDTLNQGRLKLNEAIKDADDAKKQSGEALGTANTALDNSESTQTQLDNIVIEGDSSVEAAQARVDEKGESHPTLKARIDDGFEKTNAQLAETIQEIMQIGTTTITRTDDLLISEVDMPQKKITFNRNNYGTVSSAEESYSGKTIKTTISRDDDGIVQQFNREML